MVRTSEKERQRRDLWSLWVREGLKKGWRSHTARRRLAMHEGFAEQRYLGPRRQVPKSNFGTAIIPNYEDARFRSQTRVDPRSFTFIVDLISDHPVFQNNSHNPQDSIRNQLYLALWRLGHDGNASSFMNAAGHWGVSEGHINNCTRRVVKALFQKREDFIQWPDTEERRKESFSNSERGGFSGCIGKVDGTDIVLAFKPGGEYDGEHYWNRKSKYALNLCGVCDSNNKFTYVLTGYSAATHDSRVYSRSQLQLNPQNFFSTGQYLLGDSAYVLTSTVVVPYKAPLSANKENRTFNKRLSHLRVDIEHTFGILKGRWGSLKGLRIMINSQQRYEYSCMWIYACIVLHNILCDLKDDWAEDEEEGGSWWTPEEAIEHDQEVAELARRETSEGNDKREEVKRMVLNFR